MVEHEIEEAVVDDAKVLSVAQLTREFREPRMVVSGRREDVRLDTAALLFAQLRVRRARPAAHQSERMADADQRGALVRDDPVEEIEKRRFPIVVFVDALRRLRQSVVAARIELTGAAGADVERKAAVRRLGDHESPADVVRQRADLQPFRHEPLARLLRRFENRVHERVVTDVRPRMVHVENGDIFAGSASGTPSSVRTYSKKSCCSWMSRRVIKNLS